MWGALFLWNAVASVLQLTDSSSTTAPTTVPPTTAAPAPTTTPHHTTNTSTIKPVLKKTISGVAPRMPPAPPVKPIATKVSCPAPARKTKPGETVYITLDDGPSPSSRKLILQALAPIDAKITFYESGYNICPQVHGLTLDCDDAAKAGAIELWTWTIKQGHMLASHSDTHFYDKATSLCNYIKMSAATPVPDKYHKCGTDATADFVRGAYRFEETMALADESVWETDAERALFQKQLKNVWTYGRLPCTNVWRMEGNYAFEYRLGVDGPEKAMRIGVADAILKGNNTCKHPDLQGQPWFTTGWDVEWIWKEIKDHQTEMCRMVQLIEDEFNRPGREPRRSQAVVVLGHDYHYKTPENAAMLRDLMVELKLRGYAIDTIDNLKIGN